MSLVVGLVIVGAEGAEIALYIVWYFTPKRANNQQNNDNIDKEHSL